ncbi:tetratricopeptide repeat protein [Maribacter sp.]|uniref:tetratricopeptide repeat protein n=1 Tax=Maribacter sp. TaxID=1897614 RepID=UPI0025B8437B|nr:tetratricopeptide repeat protein [Maribacter sp.]
MKKIYTFIAFFITMHFIGFTQQDSNKNDSLLQKVEGYIYSDSITPKKAKKLFKKLKTLAKEENADATCLLGILYKDGIGTRLNFNKARKQFKKAFELGNDKAAYSLGYMYLKGLGNINQDYKKAIHWFRKRKYPMAKHWLAQCYYYGYGVPIDKEKAIGILKENLIVNSTVLLSQWEYENSHPEILLENKSTTDNSEDIKASSVITTSNEDQVNTITDGVLGKWFGEWQIMDWSGEKIRRAIPIEMEILETGSGILDTKIVLDNNEFKGNVIINNKELVFPDMTVNLRKRYTDHPNELTLDSRFLSFIYELSNIHGVPYMSGILETNIVNWSEPGAPSKLILQRNKTALSKEVIAALAEQKEHFIKVYPNPFEQDLLLHYTLEKDTDVSIQLLDYYQPSKILKTKNRRQKKGERTVVLEGLNSLEKGLYIINMNVGSSSYSRIVVRK